MGYENYHTLKVVGKATKIEESSVCPECGNVSDVDSNFCNKCGTKTEIKEVEVEITDNLISEFRVFSEDAGFLLDNSGDSNEPGSGHTIGDDILKFSKKYPSVVFQMDIQWDNGFEEDPSRTYFKNGLKQEVEVELVFEDFDENKLK